MSILIAETHFDTRTVIEEDSNGKKSLYITGPFMQAEVTNRNGRLYPLSTMQREVERYIKNYVKENRALGELNHPASPIVNLERASHLITQLEFKGNDVIGKAKLLETPMGQIAKSLVNEGVKIGVSTRGVGSLKENNGVNIVQDDFTLATVDIVSDPSASECWVDGIMEGRQWVMENGIWHEYKMDQIKKEINEAPRGEDRERVIFEAFKKFLRGQL